MKRVLTQYGIDDIKITLDAFSRLTKDMLSGDITKDLEAVSPKILRKFKMKEASEMIGRSDAYLRKLEKENEELYSPEKHNSIRYYSLKLINRLRDKAGTRYRRPIGTKPVILSVSNFKGGVGKSITSKTLADKFAFEGLRVLSIGMDAQGTDSLYYGIIPDIDIEPHETIRPALIEDPSQIKKLIKKTYFPGIDIIPGNLSLNDVEIKLTDYKEQMKQIKTLGMPDERLKKALEFISDDYDVILLDCGPNLNILTLNSIEACNGMLIPVPPASPDLASFGTYCSTLSSHLGYASRKSRSMDFLRIVITKHPNNSTAHRLSKIMRDNFGTYMTLRNIVYSAEIEKAASEFCSLYEVLPSSRRSYIRAMESIESVTNEIFDAIKMIWESQVNKYEETINE